jgi:peptidyl-prolyl cis-trans isomerase C
MMTSRGKALSTAALAVAFALAFSLPAAAAVLARVDGTEITDDDVATAMEDIGPSLPEQLDETGRRAYVLNYLIDMKLLAKRAAADKVDSGPDFQRGMAYFHDKLLMQTLLGSVAKNAATDEALHKVYDDAAKAHPPEPEIHARHILVATEEEAKTALARVKGGEDFAKVADELSKDPGSKGGDLGWFIKDKMVPEFAEAAFKLKKGEISDPVKSPFGWHIIQVEDIRQSQMPPFDSVKDEIMRYVGQQAESGFVGDLRSHAKIERTEAAPAAQTLPPGHPGMP